MDGSSRLASLIGWRSPWGLARFDPWLRTTPTGVNGNNNKKGQDNAEPL